MTQERVAPTSLLFSENNQANQKRWLLIMTLPLLLQHQPKPHIQHRLLRILDLSISLRFLVNNLEEISLLMKDSTSSSSKWYSHLYVRSAKLHHESQHQEDFQMDFCYRWGSITHPWCRFLKVFQPCVGLSQPTFSRWIYFSQRSRWLRRYFSHSDLHRRSYFFHLLEVLFFYLNFIPFLSLVLLTFQCNIMWCTLSCSSSSSSTWVAQGCTWRVSSYAWTRHHSSL